MLPDTEPTPAPSSLTDTALGRVIGVLVSPVKTFESIRRRPTWLAPLLVLAITGFGTSLLVMQKVDFAEMMRTQLAKQGQQMSDAQIEKFAGIQGKVGLGCAVLAAPVFCVVAALVLMVVFNLLGGEVGFPASLSVTVHAAMPWVIAGLLGAVVALGRSEIDYETLQSGGLLASHLGALAPPDTSPALLALLGSIDVFWLWSIILAVIGFAVVAGVSRVAAAVTAIALWMLLVAGKVALAALGASRMKG